MPHKSKRAPRKRRTVRKHRVRRATAVARSPGTMGNMCTITETVEPINILGNTGYYYQFQIGSYSRALALQPYFQEYSLKSCRIVYEPLQPLGSGVSMLNGPARKGDLYFVRNPDGIDPVIVNLNYLQEMGAKPKPFGSSTARNVMIKYKPNIVDTLFADPAGALTLGAKRASKQRWLSCWQPTTGDTLAILDNTQWQGHFVWIDDPENPGQTTPPQLPVCRVTVETVWQFRRPYNQAPVTGPSTVKIIV